MKLNLIIILLGHLIWCCDVQEKLLKKLAIWHGGTWQDEIGILLAKLMKQYIYFGKNLSKSISSKIIKEMEEKNDKVFL